MGGKLRAGDVEGSLSQFDDTTKGIYENLSNLLSAYLPAIVQEIADIELVESSRDTAIYDIRT